ncbi:MAG: glycosyltransferase family A protein [Pseudomonadota bacterium]
MAAPLAPAPSRGSGSPSLSVVIAAYNAQAHLEETLESLRRQSLSDFEVVAVDDGSTDATAAQLKTAASADPRLRILTQTNGGVSAARNFGLAHARAPFIVFLDADDLLTPDALRTFCDHMEASAAPAAYGGHIKFAETAAAPDSGEAPSQFRRTPEQDTLRALLARNFIVNGGALCIRRSAAEAAGGFDPKLKLGEDWEFWCRLALLGDFDRIDGFVPLLYRQRASGANARLSLGDLWRADHAACDAVFANSDIRARFSSDTLRRARRGFLRNAHWSTARMALAHQGPAPFLAYAAAGAIRFPESAFQGRAVYLFLRSLLKGSG